MFFLWLNSISKVNIFAAKVDQNSSAYLNIDHFNYVDLFMWIPVTSHILYNHMLLLKNFVRAIACVILAPLSCSISIFRRRNLNIFGETLDKKNI